MASLPLAAMRRALLLGCLMSGFGLPTYAQAASHTVVIEAMRFSPATIEVRAGDTVTWENRDFFPHTATASGKKFDSGQIGSGARWRFTPRSKGVYPYICTLHPGMKGVLVVK